MKILALTLLVFCAIIQLNPTSAWWSKSGGGGGGGATRSHDIKSQSGLTNLYNQKIKTIERVSRKMANVPVFKHQGVRVTLDDGSKFLVHKGSGYGGRGGQNVVTNARHMSKKWSGAGARKVNSGATLGDLVKAGGKNYNVAVDNCYHGATRMEKKAGGN